MDPDGHSSTPRDDGSSGRHAAVRWIDGGGERGADRRDRRPHRHGHRRRQPRGRHRERFRPGRGDGTGIFSTGPLSLSANHTLDFFVRPGATNRINAHGSVNLFLATLELRKNGGVQVDTPLMLIDNDGNDPVGGTFAGLPEGAFVNAGDQVFRITYTGGTGNDVMITPTELTYFLSEGSTGTFFDTDILIANPHNTTVPVTVEFLVEGGGQVITQDYLLPRSRARRSPSMRFPDSNRRPCRRKCARRSPSRSSSNARCGGQATRDTARIRRRRAQARRTSGISPKALRASSSRICCWPIRSAQDNEATVRFLLRGRRRSREDISAVAAVASDGVGRRRARTGGTLVRHRGDVRSRRRRRTRDVFRHGAALDGGTRIRGRAGAGQHLVPRGGRDRTVLRNVHPAREPERGGCRCDGALPAGERDAGRQAGAGAGERAPDDQHRDAGSTASRTCRSPRTCRRRSRSWWNARSTGPIPRRNGTKRTTASA